MDGLLFQVIILFAITDTLAGNQLFIYKEIKIRLHENNLRRSLRVGCLIMSQKKREGLLKFRTKGYDFNVINSNKVSRATRKKGELVKHALDDYLKTTEAESRKKSLKLIR